MAEQKPGLELLSRILESHGGLDRWQRIEKIQVEFDFYGALLDFKGFPGTHRPTITVSTNGEPSAVLKSLGSGKPGDRWEFTPNKVSILSAEGAVVEQQLNPRGTLYKGHTILDPFSNLQLHYFVSYAMYNYMCVPFIFTRPGFEIEELTPHEEAGETWRVLKVTHPDTFPTHTKVQKFYWGSQDFRLRRVDYETDVLGGVAAHYCFDYKDYGGLLIPTTRRVVTRTPEGKARLAGRSAFWLHYVGVTVFDKDGSVHDKGKWIL